MILREFNESGILAFKKYLAYTRENPGAAMPVELLEDMSYTKLVSPAIEVEPCAFTMRREAAEYLVHTLAPLGDRAVATNAGLWTWLSLFYFDQVCPTTGGKRMVKNDYHYLFEPENSRHFYRHLLFLGWRVLTLAPTANRLLLDIPIAQLDKFTSEVMKRLFLTRIKCIFEVLDHIYWDHERGRIRLGVVSPGKVVAGDLIHRFPTRMRQLERTYDLVEIPAQQLIDLLGEEFQLAQNQIASKQSA